MTQDTPAFFTLDRGTAGTRAALVAPVDGRYRLLAAGATPVGIDPVSLLEDLAWRVARTDASLAGPMDGWREWSRLAVHTGRAPRAVLVAASDEVGRWLERAFGAAGWIVAGAFFGPQPGFVDLGAACLDPDVDAVVMGGRDGAEEGEREAGQRLWARAASLARFRDDLAVLAAGPFAERPEGIPDDRLFSLPAPEPVPATAESLLRQAAGQVGRHLAQHGQLVAADARVALRASVVSLAAVLGVDVEGLEIGAAAGSRTLATPQAEQRHAVLAPAALFPPTMLADDEVAESVLRWCTLAGGDPAARVDRLRELTQRPWSGLDREGIHLRLASLRAALERLDTAWAAAVPAAEGRAPGLIVLSGGGFDGLPPAASALAVIDGVRRPGAMGLLHDHAGLLAPLGALPVEADRQRLLRDLMADVLLPLGSAVVTGAIERGKKDRPGASLSMASALGDQRLRLEPGQLQLIDLPPGITARLGIDPGESAVLGIEGRTLTMEVSGGLGGLFVDTRSIPLDLPEAGEARRSVLGAWEAAIWAGSER